MVNLLNGDVFHNKEIILYGMGSRANNMERMYKSYGYEVKYYCYSFAVGNGKELYRGKRVLTPDELVEYCKTAKEEVIVQIASSFEEDILKDLQQKQLKATLLLYNDYAFFIRSQKLHFLEKANENYRKEALLDYANERKYFARNLAWADLDFYNLQKDTLNIILSCPKTGSTTLFESCIASKQVIHPVYISYTMKPFSKEYFSAISQCKKRFIGGVREPISQMMSILFFLWYTRECMFDSIYKFKNIGDCQYWFDEHFVNKGSEENALEIFCDVMETTCDIIDFYENDYYEMTGINLFNYSFNKQKGYVIIREGNVEVLIYRLDKLNQLAPVIGNYLGDQNFQLVDANRSEDRIYKEMYHKAIETIQIKKDFLEECYNSKLVQWCYTGEEIEKFKEKWEKNVVD